MIDFPNAKINLGLRVLDKRPDGYHNISTVLYPVMDICDILEIIPSSKLTFECTGPYCSGLSENNLCVEAYKLLSTEFTLSPVHIYLYKNIPVGAGLGGGSADAAFTLRLINVIFSLSLSDAQLESYALKLGSDCPFFVKNRPCLVRGRGEVLEEIGLNLQGYKITVAMPCVQVNTAWAYNLLSMNRRLNGAPVSDKYAVEAVVKAPVEEWKNMLINDFEEPVMENFPEIKTLKESFYLNGAVYASMSGSGASVYSIAKSY